MPNDVFDCFFAKEHLQKTLFDLITHNAPHTEDAIFVITHKILTENLSLAIDNHGVSFFRSDPALTLPFDNMTKSQLSSLRMLVLDARLRKKHVQAFEQCGGGLTVNFLRNKINVYYVDKCETLCALLRIMQHNEKNYNVQIMNVVLQRLLGSTILPATESKRIHAGLAELFSVPVKND